jgi:hypothetical protein
VGYFLPADRPDLPSPLPHHARMLKLAEHKHIIEAEARVEYLMRSHQEVKGGRRVLGTVFRPDVQGRLREVFQWLLEEKFGAQEGDPPIDYLIVLDADYWVDADERSREVLVYHELCHIQPAFDKYGAQRFDRETGLPVLTLAGHDVEEFSAVVRRYGAHTQELRDFIAAVSEGDGRQS